MGRWYVELYWQMSGTSWRAALWVDEFRSQVLEELT